MSLRDRIFPAERREDLVQTEWATGWFNGASGFGYAAEYLTENTEEIGAPIDQAGLAVFFLQRHRIEMVLKGTLDACDAKIPNRHGLMELWAAVKLALEPFDARAWATFSANFHEFVELIDSVDASSYTFRYPVDPQGREVTRPAFIDLRALNDYTDKLAFGAAGYVEFLMDRGLI